MTYNATPHARASLPTVPDMRRRCLRLWWATPDHQSLSMRCPASTSMLRANLGFHHWALVSAVSERLGCHPLRQHSKRLGSVVLKLMSAEVLLDAVPILLGLPPDFFARPPCSSVFPLWEHAARRALWGGGERKIAM